MAAISRAILKRITFEETRCENQGMDALVSTGIRLEQRCCAMKMIVCVVEAMDEREKKNEDLSVF